MAIISASNIIRSISLFHLITAYFLLNDPSKVASHNLVAILSSSMGFPYTAPSLQAPTTLSALLASVLTFFSLSDLSAASMHESVASPYWSTQAPVRLTFFFTLTAYSYINKPGGLAGGLGVGSGQQVLDALREASKGKVEPTLSSGMVFSWAFLELVAWFWVYITLRDERREMMAREMAKKKREEDERRF